MPVVKRLKLDPQSDEAGEKEKAGRKEDGSQQSKVVCVCACTRRCACASVYMYVCIQGPHYSDVVVLLASKQ